MIHNPSVRYHREFARSVEAVRVGMAEEGDSNSAPVLKPVLLIKATTLKLKYLIRLRTFRLLFSKLQPGRHLWYGVQIADDPANPATLWSIAESDEELTAINQLLGAEELSIFLFNEQDINVASAPVRMRSAESDGKSVTTGVEIAAEGTWKQYETAVDGLLAPSGLAKLIEAIPLEWCEWTENRSTLITQKIGLCHLALMTLKEGDQQESLAEWLIDVLGEHSAVRNPTVHEPRRVRELSDLLLSYEFGCFLLESKTLSIFDRVDVPDRSALRDSVLKHVNKAANQLAGACANIRRGWRITDKAGQDIGINRDWPIHCIILVPELSLIADCDELIPRLAFALSRNSKAFLNLVDLNELHNLVYNAGAIASKSQKLTPLMAFDAILLKRCELACQQKTPDFRFRMTVGDG